ncbi:MAG: prolipoprotein diacylglyceryl transferase [Clostridia bacterium]|nr:MAG: prolipoprotein diacylglyceryl transferase [Clostridia bacterium]
MIFLETIEFPKLGWVFHISPVLAEFSVFGLHFSIRWYGVMIALGFLLAVLYAVKFAPRFGVQLDPMIDVVLVSAVFSVLSARIYYILFYDGIATFWKEPLKIFRIWDGGLAIYGALIGAFVTGIWMCRVRKVSTLAMFDLASVGFLIGQCLGRWGNFFNQEAFGGNTTLPWGMTGSIIRAGTNGSGYDTSLPVHPTFFYESLWCLIGIVLLHLLAKKKYTFKGQIFCAYVVWYGLGRVWIEGLRTDSLMLGQVRVSQLLAAVCVLAGGVAYVLLRNRHNALPRDLFAEEEQTAEETAETGAEGTETEETENGDPS